VNGVIRLQAESAHEPRNGTLDFLQSNPNIRKRGEYVFPCFQRVLHQTTGPPSCSPISASRFPPVASKAINQRDPKYHLRELHLEKIVEADGRRLLRKTVEKSFARFMSGLRWNQCFDDKTRVE